MKKVGLFFGSFNPVHNGHLMLANYLLEFVPLDAVWFVVSPQNPLKNQDELMPEAFRLRLVKKAIGGFARFKACDTEFHLSKPSYTIHTLNALAEEFPDIDFYLIMGADSLLNFHLWKDYTTILEKYHLLVYPRKGSTEHALMKHPSVQLVEAPLIEVSSTFIRDGFKCGKDLRFFLPAEIFGMLHEALKPDEA